MNAQAKPFIPKTQNAQQSSISPATALISPPPGFPVAYLQPLSTPLFQSSPNEPTQTPIEMLCAIFPSVDHATLQETLKNNGNDLNKTILTLSENMDAENQFILEEIYNDQLEGDEEDYDREYYDDGDEPEDEEQVESIVTGSKDTTKGSQQISSIPFTPVFMYTQPSISTPNASAQQLPPSKPSAIPIKPPPTKPVNNIQSVSPAKPKPPAPTAKASTSKPPASKLQTKEQPQVCKYFLLGQCYRKDCFYVHSNAVVCKYWQLGSCSRGDSCIYMHAEPETPKKPQPPTKPTNPPQVPAQPQTPPQPQPIEAKATPSPRNPTYRKADMAAKLRLAQLQKLFHHVEENIVRDIFFSCNFNTEEATDKLTRIHGKPRKAEIEVAAPTESTFKPAPRKPKHWVATGDSVAKLYSEYRAEAIEHATIRNACFHYATTAYLQGDGLAAKEWSKRGRHHDEMMKKLHREACMKILETRNKDLSSQMIMDLHGLHKREAIEVLSQKIEFFRQQNANMRGGDKKVHAFYIIVGTGHHANVGKNMSLIGKAVQNYLDEMGIKYSDCSDDHRGGMLTVYIK